MGGYKGTVNHGVVITRVVHNVQRLSVVYYEYLTKLHPRNKWISVMPMLYISFQKMPCSDLGQSLATRLMLLWLSSVPLNKFQARTSLMSPQPFLSHPFQSTTHQLYNHSMLYSLNDLKNYNKNKTQINKM